MFCCELQAGPNGQRLVSAFFLCRERVALASKGDDGDALGISKDKRFRVERISQTMKLILGFTKVHCEEKACND